MTKTYTKAEIKQRENAMLLEQIHAQEFSCTTNFPEIDGSAADSITFETVIQKTRSANIKVPVYWASGNQATDVTIKKNVGLTTLGDAISLVSESNDVDLTVPAANQNITQTLTVESALSVTKGQILRFQLDRNSVGGEDLHVGTPYLETV